MSYNASSSLLALSNSWIGSSSFIFVPICRGLIKYSIKPGTLQKGRKQRLSYLVVFPHPERDAQLFLRNLAAGCQVNARHSKGGHNYLRHILFCPAHKLFQAFIGTVPYQGLAYFIVLF